MNIIKSLCQNLNINSLSLHSLFVSSPPYLNVYVCMYLSFKLIERKSSFVLILFLKITTKNIGQTLNIEIRLVYYKFSEF